MRSFQAIASVFFAVALGIYLLGMLIPVMEVDAAQYASISQQLLQEENFLQIKHREFDYLDKPPLLFWISSSSIALFGIGSFSYKLPSVLALLLAIYATYRYTRLEHKKETATAAALILMCCQAFFIMANDCRTDNLLIGFSMLAIWKIAAFLKYRRSMDLYIGFVAIGLAMLAKGPLGLVFTCFTIGAILLHQRRKAPISWRWLWAIPIFAIILTPMCIGLYQQHGMKGLEFFFWTQSFGRITGQSRWSNNTDALFLVHSFLWAFLPFTLVYISAVYTKIKKRIAGKPFSWMDYANLSGFFLTMFALSLSKYRLPHYIFIVCPLAAVMCAQHLHTISSKVYEKRLFILQCIFLLAVLISLLGLTFFFFGSISWWHIIAILLFLGAFWLLLKDNTVPNRLLFLSLATILSVNFALNSRFYPRLLQYQSPSEAAFFINEHEIPAEQVVGFNAYGHAFSYYLNRSIPTYGTIEEIQTLARPVYLYTNQQGYDAVQNASLDHEVLKEFDEYNVSILRLSFIDPETRPKVIKKRFLIKLPDQNIHE